MRGPAGRAPTARTGFPVTIVRPSHTYDRTLVPLDGGWTAIDRMRRGPAGRRPRRRHLAVDPDPPHRLRPRLRRRCSATRGRSARPSTSPPTTCSPGTRSTGRSAPPAGVRAAHRARPVGRHRRRRRRAGAPALLGDKAHSMVFDNSKIRSLVPDGSRPSASRRAPARSSPGTMPTPAAAGWTPGSTASCPGSPTASRRDAQAGCVRTHGAGWASTVESSSMAAPVAPGAESACAATMVGVTQRADRVRPTAGVARGPGAGGRRSDRGGHRARPRGCPGR